MCPAEDYEKIDDEQYASGLRASPKQGTRSVPLRLRKFVFAFFVFWKRCYTDHGIEAERPVNMWEEDLSAFQIFVGDGRFYFCFVDPEEDGIIPVAGDAIGDAGDLLRGRTMNEALSFE